MTKNESVMAAMRYHDQPVTIGDIAYITELPYRDAKNAVMRLKHSQQIKRVRRYPSEYVVRRSA